MRARPGKTARLLVGTARAPAAAAQRIDRKRATLAASAGTRVQVTDGTRKGPRTITRGRRTVTLAAGRAVAPR